MLARDSASDVALEVGPSGGRPIGEVMEGEGSDEETPRGFLRPRGRAPAGPPGVIQTEGPFTGRRVKDQTNRQGSTDSVDGEGNSNAGAEVRGVMIW